MISSLLKPAIVLNEKKYKVINQIGEGAFGYVFHVRETIMVKNMGRISGTAEIDGIEDHPATLQGNNKDYALKKMICQLQEQIAEAQKEIEIMSSIRHPHVLPLLDSSHSKNKKGQEEYLLLMPLLTGSAQTVIDKHIQLLSNSSPRVNSHAHGQSSHTIAGCKVLALSTCAFRDGHDVLKILKHIAQGLQAVHIAGYRHADLKPANVLLSSSFDAMLTDFGSAMPISQVVRNRSEALCVQEKASIVTTASFRAPELFNTPNNIVIDGKADIWSFGCLMYAMLYSRTPFEHASEGLSTLSVMSGQFSFPENNIWPEDYQNIIRHCLSVIPNDRPSVAELVASLDKLPGPPLDLKKLQLARDREVLQQQEQHTHIQKVTAPSISQPQTPVANMQGNPMTVADFADFSLVAVEPTQKAIAGRTQSGSIDEFGDFSAFDRDSINQCDEQVIDVDVDGEYVVSISQYGSNSSTSPVFVEKSDTASPSTSSLVPDPGVIAFEPFEADFPAMSTEHSISNVVQNVQPNVDEGDVFDTFDGDDDFGDFSSAIPADPSSIKRSSASGTPQAMKKAALIDLVQLIVSESKYPSKVLREGIVYGMRMGGFPKKLMKKQVTLAINVPFYLVKDFF